MLLSRGRDLLRSRRNHLDSSGYKRTTGNKMQAGRDGRRGAKNNWWHRTPFWCRIRKCLHSCAKRRTGKMNYDTKDRIHSSQKEGKWTSKPCPRVMLLELYKLCTLPKDKHRKVKGKAALFLFTISLQWFSRHPNLGSCKTETWAGQWGERVRTGMMLNPSNLCITSPDSPASQLLVGWYWIWD